MWQEMLTQWLSITFQKTWALPWLLFVLWLSYKKSTVLASDCHVLSFFVKHFHRFGPFQLGSYKYELILLFLGGILECWRVPRSASNNRGAWSTSQKVSMLWWFAFYNFDCRLKPHTVHAVPIKTEGNVMCSKHKKVELSLCIPKRHRGRLEV